VRRIAAILSGIVSIRLTPELKFGEKANLVEAHA